MPYVPGEDRPLLEPKSEVTPTDEGGLNFQITTLFIQYVEENGIYYGTLNDVWGAALGAVLEFYRRVAVPYEEAKMKLNGDLAGYVRLTERIERMTHGS